MTREDEIYWVLVKSSNMKTCHVGEEEPIIEMRQFLDIAKKIDDTIK